mgnify:CR=1 FL=1
MGVQQYPGRSARPASRRVDGGVGAFDLKQLDIAES